MALLIIGLMFGSITAAIVSVLSYFSNAEKLQQFIYWSFGSVGNLSWSQLTLLLGFVSLGVLLSIGSIKSLNGYLLGENYAQSLGINLKKSRIILLLCDIVAQLPGSVNVLPINAITSIIGAPVVIWLLLRKRKMVF